MNQTLFYTLWLSVPVIESIIIWLLFRRKIRDQHPIFLNYLILKVASSLIQLYFFQQRNKTGYFYGYWTSSALGTFLGFGVLYEIFCSAFRPFVALQDLAKLMFRWAALVLLVIAGCLAKSSAPNSAAWLTTTILHFERSVSVMQCGLLVFLYLMISYLGLSWRSRLFGLALGYGLLATVNLTLISLLMTAHSNRILIDTVNGGAFITVLLIWLTYVALPEPARKHIQLPVTSPLIRWNEAATALGRSGGQVAFPTDSPQFMPHVERMVEEVMRKDMLPERRSQA